MKYLCLVYLPKDRWSAVPDRECANCGDGLRRSGKLLAAEPLEPIETATSVRIRNGMLTITDGPFAETKEALAGFYLVDAARPRRGDRHRLEDPARARGDDRSPPRARAAGVAAVAGRGPTSDVRGPRSEVRPTSGPAYVWSKHGPFCSFRLQAEVGRVFRPGIFREDLRADSLLRPDDRAVADGDESRRRHAVVCVAVRPRGDPLQRRPRALPAGSDRAAPRPPCTRGWRCSSRPSP
jgi:hypothetical protein